MTDEELFQRLLKVFELNRRELAAAGADQILIEAYATTIAFLRRRGVEVISPKRLPGRTIKAQFVLPSENEITSLSLNEIETLTNNENAPRKLLEAIAVLRFHVPRGSMRSYSNVKKLKEKILTSVTNARAHETIRTVARQSRP